MNPAPTPDSETVRLEVTMTADMRDQLREIAKAEHRSPGGTIRALVDQHLTNARRQGEVTR